jgi:hypothetical protein
MVSSAASPYRRPDCRPLTSAAVHPTTLAAIRDGPSAPRAVHQASEILSAARGVQ